MTRTLSQPRTPARTPAKTSDAIIYCRVSDKGQVENGNGLGSQETTCREYAERTPARNIR